MIEIKSLLQKFLLQMENTNFKNNQKIYNKKQNKLTIQKSESVYNINIFVSPPS